VIRLAQGAATAGLIGGFADRSMAQAAPHRFQLGDAEVTVLSDGSMTLPLSFALPATDAKVAAALLQADAIKADVNVVVVKTPSALIVIDCGGTPDFMPTLGAFPERLERAGFKAEDVTHVIFTHAHADHLWGVIDPLDDDTRFPKARHLMTAAERDYWLRPGLADTVPDALKGMTIGSARRLKLLEKRIETVKMDAEIIPGVALVATPGHTPGHVAVQLSFGGASLIVGGDAIGNIAVSFQQPDWAWGPDLDRDLGAATRRKLLDRLVADRTLLLGYHLPWPGVGRVERKDQAYRFVAA
jgi:glyoxylase-like metal-dependent hydrolase (beta-lactamase superfamily II)